jgi:hypothetical protein
MSLHSASVVSLDEGGVLLPTGEDNPLLFTDSAQVGLRAAPPHLQEQILVRCAGVC